jgi:Flp pilus assembly protein TadG
MIRRPFALLRRLRRDRSGATLVEFAFVGPVLILMIMGLFDIAHTQYTRSVLHGAVQKAGRDLTLESAGSREAVIDARVREQVETVMPSGADVRFEKLAHADFADIGEPEIILGDDDQGEPGHGVCEASKSERYVDANNNSRWDSNRGSVGIGGARDAVLYTVIVTYPRMFPMYSLVGIPSTVTVEASTVLRSQPFDEQDRTQVQRNC